MEQKNNNLMVGMSVFGAIFFIFGFATTFIITLTAPVKAIFGLSEFGAQLLSSAFFIAYPIMSIPTGKLIDKIGYKWTVISGLVLMGIGSLIFIPAAKIPSFPIFLFGTFILATGVVFLQVAANPYVTAIGPEKTASSRLNLTQALNSIATMVAPWLIPIAIFKGLDLPSDDSKITAEQGIMAADKVPFPFIIIAIIVILVAIAIFTIKLPVLAPGKKGKKSIWKYPYMVLGAIGIFVYVGAEVGNAGLLVNYLKTNLSMTAEMAFTYAAIYWGGASGLINAVIVGGAVIPPLMGWIADSAGYAWAFLGIPGSCFLLSVYFLLRFNRERYQTSIILKSIKINFIV